MGEKYEYAVLTKPREDWWEFVEIDNGHNVLASGVDALQILKAVGELGWEATCYCPIEGGKVLFKKRKTGV